MKTRGNKIKWVKRIHCQMVNIYIYMKKKKKRVARGLQIYLCNSSMMKHGSNDSIYIYQFSRLLYSLPLQRVNHSPNTNRWSMFNTTDTFSWNQTSTWKFTPTYTYMCIPVMQCSKTFWLKLLVTLSSILNFTYTQINFTQPSRYSLCISVKIFHHQTQLQRDTSKFYVHTN